jgi:DNA-binding response OmpR family regulator
MNQDVTPDATLLLVDDDVTTRKVVTNALEHAGYTVKAVETGAEAERAVLEYQPALSILDVFLPDTDGLMLCTRLLSLWPAPIIMLSASERESDRVLSLQLGADDFISKPFEVPDLVARVHAVLRRSRIHAPPEPSLREPSTVRATAGHGHEGTIQVGSLAVNLKRRAVTVNGQRIGLTPSEQRLLTLLASEPGRVFSREELAGALGDEGLAEGRSIDVHVRRIRAKLHRHPDAPDIETVRGFGYLLNADADDD